MTTQEILFILDENTKKLFNGTEFYDVDTSKTKEYYSASILSPVEIKIHGFMMPKSASAQKIEIQAEMKMFDEANLDPEAEYQISSLTIPLQNNDDNYIESYAVETSRLENIFGEMAKKCKQIDFISPPYLSYIALYSFELLEKKSDLFIHLGDDASYAVIFKDGHYISTRVLPSINEIAQKVGVHLADMRVILSTKGLDSSLYSDAEFIQMGNTEDEISKIVEKISHSVGHKRGIFKLESLDRIYLDFEGKSIPGFLELFNNFGYESASKEILDIFPQIDASMKHSALHALYALGDIQEKHKVLNLSIFERKPSFLQSNVGQLSIVTLISTLIAAAFPLYAAFTIESLATQESTLSSSVTKLDESAKQLRAQLEKIKTQEQSQEEELAQEHKRLETLSRTVESALGFDKEALERQKMFKEINLAMKKYGLSSKSILYSEDAKMVVQIISKYNQRDNISKFIKELLRQNYAQVQTDKVERFDNYYESVVEIYR